MKKTFFRLLLICTPLLLSQSCGSEQKENTGAAESVKDSCCIKQETEKDITAGVKSEITCPQCGHKATEVMPTDVCLLRYTCKNCKTDLYPKEGDCCVFCTHGTHKCPSKQ